MQSGDRERHQHADDAQPEGEDVGNDQVVEVDEGRGDEAADKEPAGGGDAGIEGAAGRKTQPAGDKE